MFEFEFIEFTARITGHGPFKRNEKYQLTKLNEHMRFLKYGVKQYFQRKFKSFFFSPDLKLNSNSPESFSSIQKVALPPHPFLVINTLTTAHQDEMYFTPSGLERFFYTLHFYLNESPLTGGATTFHSYGMDRRLDVVSKIDRVLLFQHRGLLHSNDDVLDEMKFTLKTDLMFKTV